MKIKNEESEGLTRRDFLYLGGMGMAGMALNGIPGLSYGQEKKPKYGGRLRVGERYGSSGLDPHKNQEFIDYQNASIMYSGLTQMGKLPDVEIYPLLAKSWEISKDEREYLFALREGVKFHHGKELDSADVKYSIERVMNPAVRSPRAFAFRWIDLVNIIDKYRLQIKLKEPFAPFLSTLTIHNCAIIPANWEPTATKPAPGTGPFVFKSFVPNETVEYTRFDQFWETDENTGDRLPYLDGVFMKKVTDETVRWTALRAGDLDYIVSPPAHILAPAMQGTPVPGIFMDYDLPGTYWVIFNTSKPPFDNKKVRHAIAHAVDKKQLLKAQFWGIGKAVNDQPFQTGSRFCIPIPDREVDLAKAKQLLAEAGYPDGFKMEFLEVGVSLITAGAEAFVGQLRKIGIEGTLKVIDRAPYLNLMKKGDYNISYGSDSARYDWDDAFFMHLHSGEIGRNNYSRYSNKELDALLEQGRRTIKWEERIGIYKRVIEIIREDLPVLYTTKSVVGAGLRDYIKGYRTGFSVRFAWYGGGIKYWWIDKSGQ